MRASTSSVSTMQSWRSIGSGRLSAMKAMPGTIKRERDREPAAFEREGKRKRERRNAAAGIDRGRGGAAGRERAAVQPFGREPRTTPPAASASAANGIDGANPVTP